MLGAWPLGGGGQVELGLPIWQQQEQHLCSPHGEDLLQTGKFKQPQEGRFCTRPGQM